jgi:hypothetical protein
MASTSCELSWLTALLHDFHVPPSQASLFYCDSKAALYIAANPVFHKRTKHIELDCHLVRDKIQQGSLRTMHINSQLNLADLFTKAVGLTVFARLLPKMNVLNIFCSAPSS